MLATGEVSAGAPHVPRAVRGPRVVGNREYSLLAAEYRDAARYGKAIVGRHCHVNNEDDARMSREITVLAESHDIVGEGPVWMPGEDVLYWIDNEAGIVHQKSGERERSWTAPAGARAVVPLSDGSLVVVGDSSLHVLSPGNGEFRYVRNLPPPAGTAWNDARADPEGNLWVGSFDLEETNPIGSLFRVGPSGVCDEVHADYILTNGFDWSTDGRLVYVTDSIRRQIVCYEMGQDRLVEPTVLVHDDPAVPALPDGLLVDSDGCLWSAKWDGWSVVRYDPTGREIETIELPTARPTSCALDESGHLYVTTATFGLSPDELAQQPLAGSVLCVQVDARPQAPRFLSPAFAQASHG